MSYSLEQLREIYRRYADLKGWSTRTSVVKDIVNGWMNGGIGNVGHAITFYETGDDPIGIDRNAGEQLSAVIHEGGPKALASYRFFRFLIDRDRANGTYHFACRECGKILKARNGQSGRPAFCRRCKEPLTVPGNVDDKAGDGQRAG